jgi:hypothetical protein
MGKNTLCLIFALLVFGAGLGSIAFPSRAAAANGTNWQAGHVIDDGVFINKDGMNQAQIQDFLNQKVGTGYYGKTSGQCDTYGAATSELGGGTRADYGAAHGNPKPFTCLKDYYEVPKTDPTAGIPASNYGGAAIPAGAESAAQIIWEAGQRYSINPKVLLVLIQKESAGPLTTDDWPFRSQYTYAMGAHCPDGPNGAQCDSNYAGFSIQIFESARLLRYYLDNMQQSYWTYAKPNQVNSVRWNTQYSTYTDGSGNTAQCGAGDVYISTKATAALYTYTPYQPNQAALNNLYGSVPTSSSFDSRCAAYGNRNFWRIFQDWFGNIYADPYSAAYYSQSAYPQVNPGQPANVFLEYQNLGSQSWYDDSSLSGAPSGTYPVHLATSHAINRISVFSSTWPSANRPANTFAAVYESDGTTLAANQHVAQPGQIVKFSFAVTSNSTTAAGTYQEYFQPIAEGSPSGAFPDPQTYLGVAVNAVPAVNWVDQSPYPTLAPSVTSTTTLRVKNTGNVALYDDSSLASAPSGTMPLHLATAGPINRCSGFASGWQSCSRPAVNFAAVYESDGTTLAANQHVAQPGQIVKFSFGITPPAGYAAGTYTENFQPILEGAANGGLANLGIYFTVTVPTSPAITYTSALQNQTLAANQPATVTVQIRNTGNTTLPAGTQIISDNGEAFRAASWSSATVIGTIGSSVAPNQTLNLMLNLLAPSNIVSQQPIHISLTDAGNALIPNSTTSFLATVLPAVYQASFAGQTSYPSLTLDQQKIVAFSYKNSGNQLWYDDTSLSSAVWRAPYPIHLATSAPLNRCSGFASGWQSCSRPAVNFAAVYESDGTTLAANQHVAQPGQIVKFSFGITPAPWVSAATYREYFQPIAEGSAGGLLNVVGTYQDITMIEPNPSVIYSQESASPTISRGNSSTVYFQFKNSGNISLYDDTSVPSGRYSTHLATTDSINRSSSFGDSSWQSASRPAVNFAAVYESDGTTLAANQHVAQPGQIVKFSFVMQATPAAGTYKEYFQPVLENAPNYTWNIEGVVWTQVTVQ